MTPRLRFPRTCPICGHPPGRRTIGLPPAFICDRGHSWRVQECPPGQHTMRMAAPGMRRCRDCGFIAGEQAGPPPIKR